MDKFLWKIKQWLYRSWLSIRYRLFGVSFNERVIDTFGNDLIAYYPMYEAAPIQDEFESDVSSVFMLSFAITKDSERIQLVVNEDNWITRSDIQEGDNEWITCGIVEIKRSGTDG